MPDIMGVELKSIKINPGIEHDCVFAKLYIDGKKAGELIDDGWCDELYIEFKNDSMEKKFRRLVNKYYSIKGIDSNRIDTLIDALLHINGYYRSVKDPTLSNCYQLTFL